MLFNVSYIDFPVDIVVMSNYASPTPIFSSAFIIIMFKLRTWHIGLLRLSAIRHQYGRSLTAANAGSYVVLLQRKRFSKDWRSLDQRLAVRQRHSGTPFTGNVVYVCIYSVCRTPLFSRTQFPLASSRPTGFRGVWTSDSCSPQQITPRTIVTPHTWYPFR